MLCNWSLLTYLSSIALCLTTLSPNLLYSPLFCITYTTLLSWTLHYSIFLCFTLIFSLFFNPLLCSAPFGSALYCTALLWSALYCSVVNMDRNRMITTAEVFKQLITKTESNTWGRNFSISRSRSASDVALTIIIRIFWKVTVYTVRSLSVLFLLFFSFSSIFHSLSQSLS